MNLTFKKATMHDRAAIERLWLKVLTEAFRRTNHASDFTPEDELAYKMRQFDRTVTLATAHYYMVYDEAQFMATIAYQTPPNEGILRRTGDAFKDDYEIGSLYIDPQRQNEGLSTPIIIFILEEVLKQGIQFVCFDSILAHAQKLWVKRFGPPLHTFPSDDQSFVVYLWRIEVSEALRRLKHTTNQ